MTSRNRRRALFAAVCAVSVVILFAPGPAVPASPHNTDKLVHGALFAALGLTGSWAFRHVVAVLTALAAYAAISEIVQVFAPIGRDGDVGDALTDLVGLLAGAVIAYLIARRRSSEKPSTR